MADATASSAASPRRPKGGRRVFKHDAEGTVVVSDGYMSDRDAQDTLMAAFEEWGVRATTDEQIDEYLGPISQALVSGTSAERDFSKVFFIVKNNTFCMQVLRDEAARRDRTENPVRVWARSYRNGEIAVRIHDMLKDPENVSLRQECALKYECSLDVVHFSFDTADAIVKYPEMTLSQLDRYVITQNVRNKTRSSRSAFIGGTEGGSIQDSAAHTATVTAPAGQSSAGAPAINVKSAGRAGFASLR